MTKRSDRTSGQVVSELRRERWYGRVRLPLQNLKLPGRSRPARFVTLLDELHTTSEGTLSREQVESLGLGKNLSRVTRSFAKRLREAEIAAGISQRASVSLEDGHIQLRIRPVTRTLVLLTIAPGRKKGLRATPPLIAALKEYSSQQDKRFRLVLGGHLLSGPNQVFLILEGLDRADFADVQLDFVRMLEATNDALWEQYSVVYQYNMVPILDATEFDEDFVLHWQPEGDRE